MKRIRMKIQEINESAARLIQPTQFFSVSEIPKNSEITDSYKSILNGRFIGSQYDWLARFCEDRGFSRLQLCIHEDDKAAVVVAPMIANDRDNTQSVRLNDHYAETHEYRLFRYFEFPILDLTKTEMANIAKERGWSQLMEMTWFCHNPINGKPCGRCNPCVYTIEEGLGWRIPTYRRLIGNVHRASVHPVKKAARKMLQVLQQK